jgi:hypothetical protein
MKLPSVAQGFVLATSSFTAFQIVNGVVWQPYALHQPLFEQTVAVHSPPSLEGIKLDEASSRFLTEVSDLLRSGGFRDGDRIVALHNVPGVVHAAGGISPGVVSFFFEQPATNRRALEIAAAGQDAPFVILSRSLVSQTEEDLRSSGIGFPEKYRELGSVYNPYSTGRLGWFRADERIRVFAPIQPTLGSG